MDAGQLLLVLPLYTILLYGIFFWKSSYHSGDITSFCLDDYSFRGNYERKHCMPPIDAVYTWVNGSDPVWLAKKEYYLREADRKLGENDHKRILRDGDLDIVNELRKMSSRLRQLDAEIKRQRLNNYSSFDASTLGEAFSEEYTKIRVLNATARYLADAGLADAGLVDGENPNENDAVSEDDAIGENRFRDNNELKYSLRSIEKYAPWIRHIYVVTDNQIPSWLNLDNRKLTLVTHEDIFRNKSVLPTFSSPSIEANLHRIPGLSKKFIYLNDDVMFGAPVYPEDFFTLHGGQKIYLSWEIPPCSEGCLSSWRGDGYCDVSCNVSECSYDNGDCLGEKENSHTIYKGDSSNSLWKTCSPGCISEWIGDNVCDESCNTVSCAFDGLDCIDTFNDYKEAFPFHIINATAEDVRGIEPNTKINQLPFGTRAVLINLTSALNVDEFRIDSDSSIENLEFEAEHNGSPIIASAVLLTKLQYLILVLRNDVDQSATSLDYFGETTIAGYDSKLWGGLSEEEYAQQTGVCFSGANEAKYVPGCPQNFGCERFQKLQPALKRCSVRQSCTAVTQSYDGWFETRAGNVVTQSEFGEKSWLKIANGSHAFTNSDETADGSENVLNEDFPASETCSLFFRSNTTSGSDEIRIITVIVRIRNKKIPNSKLLLQFNLTGGLQLERSSLDRQNEAGLHRSLKVQQRQLSGPRSGNIRRLKNSFLRIQRKLSRVVTGSIKLEPRLYKHVHPLKHVLSAHYTDSFKFPVMDFRNRTELWFGERHQKQRNLDAFGSSLLYVDALFNKEFGNLERKVPAHMPHMIDVDEMIALQSKFPDEFEKTSSHRFRSEDDMQYAFSYMYWIIHRGNEPELGLKEYFEMELDTDGNGYLDSNELRTLAALIGNEADVSTSWKMLVHCLYPTSGDDIENISMHMNLSSFLDCPEAVNGVLSNSRRKETHQILPEDLTSLHVAFEMLGDNFTETLNKLDSIRRKRSKFICINDDMQTAPPKTQEALREFLNALFPRVSSFELKGGKTNQFLYLNDYRKSKENENRIQAYKIGASTSFLLVLCIALISAAKFKR